jgi:hypothetical protein
MHVLAGVDANPANSRVLDLNAKFHFRSFAYGSLQEFARVLDRGWMRETVAYAQPDFAIVRVSGYRFGIIQPPGANGAPLQDKLHRRS